MSSTPTSLVGRLQATRVIPSKNAGAQREVYYETNGSTVAAGFTELHPTPEIAWFGTRHEVESSSLFPAHRLTKPILRFTTWPSLCRNTFFPGGLFHKLGAAFPIHSVGNRRQ